MTIEIVDVQQNRMDKIMELIRLALEINGLDARKQDETGNLPTVFVRTSGHVARIGIDVHEKGWAPNDSCTEIEICTDDEFDEEEYWKSMEYLRSLKESIEAGTSIDSDMIKNEL